MHINDDWFQRNDKIKEEKRTKQNKKMFLISKILLLFDSLLWLRLCNQWDDLLLKSSKKEIFE